MKLLTNLFCPRCVFFGTGAPCEDCSNEEPRTWATACSPDELIEAAIIKRIAEDFDSFRLSPAKAHPSKPGFCVVLSTRQTDKSGKFAKSIEVVIGTDNYGDFRSDRKHSVNDVEISAESAERIYNEYTNLRAAYHNAKVVAAEAKKSMEENEKRWNLAEHLLGMVRNEQGALVPVKQVEG